MCSFLQTGAVAKLHAGVRQRERVLYKVIHNMKILLQTVNIFYAVEEWYIVRRCWILL